ncbi:GrpB family protein [Psychrobacillus sp. NEAU-3TGS]|uniref:GrpB family protein n=1 Tax=Psychrobacillus sp. NEAU-3TGS TaxID=2995412 RepID=UPI002497F5F7|nr:GrpB family protein [Psychrobacillus sp. NEAU-3TGS]MDI2586201.1 GrpB family protein [Psychrobacillus sp. NEAU-3TGS]
MKLGLKNNEVRIVPFDVEWKIEFSNVKREIQSVLEIDENHIEHIGSTAIEGISAKPIIDILLGVDDIHKIDKEMERKLRVIGFYRLRVVRPNEVVFAKFEDETFDVKTHYIHAVAFKEELWENLIFFRDYLNEHNNEKMEYANIKEDYLRQNNPTDINEYTDFKEEFVKKIFAKRHL